MPMVVSCANDTQLAERLYKFLQSRFSAVSIDIDEITINADADIKRDLRKSLAEFLASNEDLTAYSITELGDLFTIGISQNIDKLVLSCEICGYLAHGEEEMIIHKRIHGFFVP